VRATAKVLSNASTNHCPVVLTIRPARDAAADVAVTTLFRRNFKAVRTADLERAIEQHGNMAALYKLRNVNDVARHVIRGITAALDKIASLEAI
jgi:hypothetical protein